MVEPSTMDLTLLYKTVGILIYDKPTHQIQTVPLQHLIRGYFPNFLVR